MVSDGGGGYLAGVLAALLTKSNSVSTVGGEKIPPVDNWIAGFQQGIIDTKPAVKFVNVLMNFVDQAKCRKIALDQISGGSDIVFQVAGDCGLGAIDAACEKRGRWRSVSTPTSPSRATAWSPAR